MRRIGEVVREQVELYGTLTGGAGRRRRGAEPRAAPDPSLADVLAPAAPRPRPDAPTRRPMSRVAVLKGGRLARAPGLAALGRARRGRAAAPRPRGRRDRRRPRPRRAAARRPRPTSRSSRCTAATARTARSRSCSRSSASRTPRSGVSACMRCADKVLAKHAMRDAGIPTPDFYVVQRDRVQGARRGRGAAAAIEERLEFPIVVKPADQGSALGVQVRALAPPTSRRRSWPRSRTRRRCCSSATSTGRELAVSILGDEPLPVVEAVPREEDFYDFSARYTIGRTAFVCPAAARRRADRARPVARARRVPPARLPRLRPRRPDARGGHRRALRARGQRDPRADRDEPAPEAADAAGIDFDELIARIVEMALQPA